MLNKRCIFKRKACLSSAQMKGSPTWSPQPLTHLIISTARPSVTLTGLIPRST